MPLKAFGIFFIKHFVNTLHYDRTSATLHFVAKEVVSIGVTDNFLINSSFQNVAVDFKEADGAILWRRQALTLETGQPADNLVYNKIFSLPVHNSKESVAQCSVGGGRVYLDSIIQKQILF